jgi:phage shock protein E
VREDALMDRRMNRYALVLLLGLSPLAAQANRPAVAPAAVAELAARADAPLVLDVRTPEEFAAGHVPGAILIPHDQLSARLGELDRSRWVLVYCKSGRRAGIAEELLVKEGFEVRQIEGSWLRWTAEGRPAETGATEAESRPADAVPETGR